MKKLLAIIIALAIAFAGGYFVSWYFDAEEEYSVDPEILSQEIVEISEMATNQDTYSMSVPYNGGKKSFPIFDQYKIPFSEKTMVVKFSGTIKMGLKMDGFTADNIEVDQEAKTVKVTLPHSVVLSHEILEDTWEVGNQKNGLFNHLNPEDDSKLRKQAKEQALEKQDIDSMLAEADENAEKQIRNFLQAACPGMDIEVEFK